MTGEATRHASLGTAAGEGCSTGAVAPGGCAGGGGVPLLAGGGGCCLPAGVCLIMPCVLVSFMTSSFSKVACM